MKLSKRTSRTLIATFIAASFFGALLLVQSYIQITGGLLVEGEDKNASVGIMRTGVYTPESSDADNFEPITVIADERGFFMPSLNNEKTALIAFSGDISENVSATEGVIPNCERSFCESGERASKSSSYTSCEAFTFSGKIKKAKTTTIKMQIFFILRL